MQGVVGLFGNFGGLQRRIEQQQGSVVEQEKPEPNKGSLDTKDPVGTATVGLRLYASGACVWGEEQAAAQRARRRWRHAVRYDKAVHAPSKVNIESSSLASMQCNQYLGRGGRERIRNLALTHPSQ